MTWMMWGYPILGNIHFVLRREGNFRCNSGSTLMEPSLTCSSRGGWWLIWGLPNYIYILYYIYIIYIIYILYYIYILYIYNIYIYMRKIILILEKSSSTTPPTSFRATMSLWIQFFAFSAEVISCTAKFPLRSSPRLMQSSAWAPGVASAKVIPQYLWIVLHHPNEDIQDITRIYLG